MAPPAPPHWATARDGSRYVAISIYPRTVDELRTLCLEYGQAAVVELYWKCVTLWLMSGPDAAELSNPSRVAIVAVTMVQERDRIRLGWPRHNTMERRPPALESLSPDVREEAERVAAETLSDWERMGKPHLGQHRIKTTYQYLISCPDFRNKYVRPLDDNDLQETE